MRFFELQAKVEGKVRARQPATTRFYEVVCNRSLHVAAVSSSMGPQRAVLVGPLPSRERTDLRLYKIGSRTADQQRDLMG